MVGDCGTGTEVRTLSWHLLKVRVIGGIELTRSVIGLT